MGCKARIFVVFIAAFALVVPASAQTHLSGAVRDSEGAVISGARILIHWDSSGSKVGLTSNVGINQDRTLKTDANGSFSVELPPGFYDVFVSAMAFSPDCRKVRLKARQTETYNVKLNVSPVVSRELGDVFK